MPVSWLCLTKTSIAIPYRYPQLFLYLLQERALVTPWSLTLGAQQRICHAGRGRGLANGEKGGGAFVVAEIDSPTRNRCTQCRVPSQSTLATWHKYGRDHHLCRATWCVSADVHPPPPRSNNRFYAPEHRVRPPGWATCWSQLTACFHHRHRCLLTQSGRATLPFSFTTPPSKRRYGVAIATPATVDLTDPMQISPLTSTGDALYHEYVLRRLSVHAQTDSPIVCVTGACSCVWGYFRAQRFAGDFSDWGQVRCRAVLLLARTICLMWLQEIQTRDFLKRFVSNSAHLYACMHVWSERSQSQQHSSGSWHVTNQERFLEQARFDCSFDLDAHRDLLTPS